MGLHELSPEAKAGALRAKAWKSFGGETGTAVTRQDLNKLFDLLSEAEGLQPSRDCLEICYTQSFDPEARHIAQVEHLIKKSQSAEAIFQSTKDPSRSSEARRIAFACSGGLNLLSDEIRQANRKHPLLTTISNHQAEYGRLPHQQSRGPRGRESWSDPYFGLHWGGFQNGRRHW